jgi:hypothetical protein
VSTQSEIKEEKKSALKETPQTESISKGNLITRAKPIETQTPAPNTNIIQRATAPTSTTQTNTGFVRGTALQKGTSSNVEEKKSDAKDGGWRKK